MDKAELKDLRRQLLKAYGSNLDYQIRDIIHEKTGIKIGYIKIGNMLKGIIPVETIVLEVVNDLLTAEKKKQAKLLKKISSSL